MDSSQLDQADRSSPDSFSDSSLPPDSPDTSDIFGEPLVHPRVGDEFQVEIPPMLTEPELLRLRTNPANFEGPQDPSHSFLMGLPVPVMRVSSQTNPVKDERVETEGQTSISNLYCIVPGVSTVSWTDFETDCFLLGLYVFGKNLLQVKRFMESKDMGNILSFYYGRFYGTAGFRKWSECRRMRNKKCVIGHRFFTGYRQQELFSRLLPRLSEESKPKWLEASRAFTEGRTSLDEYVSTLKALVGLHALVEAVGIGKGKEDLTTLFLDSSKNSNRPEMPSGKACSSLTCAEIVKYLTGDFRLSKARSNDLFWEAVWPRLLARGWHSEQPRESKNCLVFLMPGIKKFSRRKLAKGDHYFDSVSDVLAKVASEPELLELEADETLPREENGWAGGPNSDNDQDASVQERHCYLKPRVSPRFSDSSKFTVVDTSLASEENPSKVRELRSLPVEAKKRPSSFSSQLRRTDKDSNANGDVLPNGENQRIPADVNLPTDHKSRAIKHQFSRRIKSSVSTCSSAPVTKKRRLVSCVDTEVTCVLSLPARQKKGVFKGANNKFVIRPLTSQPQVKVSSSDSSVAGTSNLVFSRENERLPEEHKVIDLNLPQPEFDVKVKVDEGENTVKTTSHHHSDLRKPKHEVVQEGESSNPHSNGKTPKQNVEEEKDKNNAKSNAENPKHELQQRGSNTINPSSDVSAVGPSDTKETLLSSATIETTDNQPRRQSTRNRPLTTKALEALEIGFLNPVRHSRKRSPSRGNDQKPKRSRQPRSKNSMLPNLMGFEEREAADGTCNGKIGPFPRENELLGLSKASCSEAP